MVSWFLYSASDHNRGFIVDPHLSFSNQSHSRLLHLFTTGLTAAIPCTIVFLLFFSPMVSWFLYTASDHNRGFIVDSHLLL